MVRSGAHLARRLSEAWRPRHASSRFAYRGRDPHVHTCYIHVRGVWEGCGGCKIERGSQRRRQRVRCARCPCGRLGSSWQSALDASKHSKRR